MEPFDPGPSTIGAAGPTGDATASEDRPQSRAATAPPVAIELRESAADFANSALRAYLAEDIAVFLLHAATALEQLSKAFLASIHGSLIAANDFDSLRICAGIRAARGHDQGDCEEKGESQTHHRYLQDRSGRAKSG